MALPPMDPTGAMSSGVYVDYMIAYNNAAMDYLEEELAKYVPQSTIDAWGNKWSSILDETSDKVTDLEKAITKMKSQVIVLHQ